MARENDSTPDPYARPYDHGINGGLPGHTHPQSAPIDEEEYDDEEDEDDFESQEDDEFDEDDDVSAHWMTTKTNFQCLLGI